MRIAQEGIEKLVALVSYAGTNRIRSTGISQLQQAAPRQEGRQSREVIPACKANSGEGAELVILNDALMRSESKRSIR